MPSGKYNSVTARAMHLIFSLFGVAHLKMCLLAYCSKYNERIMDSPLSSFLSNFFLLTARGVDLQ